MKNFKPLIYLAVLAFCITSCKNESKTTVDVKDGKTATLDPDTLSVAQAKIYVANYGKRAGWVDSTFEANKPGKKKVPDTRCVWFSIARMQTLVDKIKAEGGDGIRFYLAAYDSAYTANKKIGGQKPPRPYWNHNTLIMVSTKDSLQIYHRDYYNGLTANEVGGSIIMTVPENRGELCPPPTPCGKIGASLITN